MARTAVCITSRGASVYIDGKTYLFNSGHINYAAAIAATKAKLWDLIPGLLDMTAKVQQISPKLALLGGQIYMGDEPLPTGYLYRKLEKIIEEGGDTNPLGLFIENLMENPSADSREELAQFLDACDLPITEDGHFIGYKRVNKNYRDCHTDALDNRVGCVVQMVRDQVDPDRNRTCSHGLHVCSRSYLKSFSGDHLMAVKVNPRNVVSVPKDYNNAKMRVCLYEVVEEVIEDQIDAIESTSVVAVEKELFKDADPILGVEMEPEPEHQRLGLFGRLKRFFSAP